MLHYIQWETESILAPPACALINQLLNTLTPTVKPNTPTTAAAVIPVPQKLGEQATPLHTAYLYSYPWTLEISGEKKVPVLIQTQQTVTVTKPVQCSAAMHRAWVPPWVFIPIPPPLDFGDCIHLGIFLGAKRRRERNSLGEGKYHYNCHAGKNEECDRSS